MKPLCRVCGSLARPLGTGLVLRKHRVEYQRCDACDYIQTEAPHWLEEAYASPMTAQDTGALERVLHLATVTKVLLALAFDRKGRCLDFGGGYGVFVRRMRDLGVDFRWEDRYCPNLLAQGFSAEPGSSGHELATCFEVLEHVEDPQALLAGLFSRADAVLMSTELSDGWRDCFFEWPYVAAEHGQHVGFFGERTLRTMAARLGTHFVTDGKGLHLFSKAKIPEWKLRLACGGRATRLLARAFRWRSLAMGDHEALRRNSA